MTKELNTYLPVNGYDGVNPDNWKDRLMSRPVVEHVERYKWILGDLAVRGESAWPLLEVGAGCTWGLSQIQKSFNHLSVGIDLDIKALSEGKAANISQADLLAPSLPFPEGRFSTIVNLNLLEQLNDPLTGLENMSVVAKRGGQMYVSIFNRELFSPGGEKWFGPNQHEFSKDELSELLIASNWQPVEWLGQRFVTRKSYLQVAKMLQVVENWLNKNEVLSRDKRIQIFRARVQNIIPSLNPSAGVRRLEDIPKLEPVILTARCIRV